MSSLLQFGGVVDHRGVGLLFYTTTDGDLLSQETDQYLCGRCGRKHSNLWRAFRKPVGMLGCWVQFRWDGKIHAPDLSVPIPIARPPRGAEKLTDEEATKYWHSP